MRYIFTAAICTLAVITALLALPPVGQNDATLVSLAAGDRAAITAADASPRLIVTPDDSADVETAAEEPIVDVLGLVVEDDESGDADQGSGVLTEDGSSTTSSTAAPTTTTTSSTTTTTTTTTEPPETTTTTEPPETTTTTEAPASDGGVIISPRGIVLPIIGPAPDGGWRVKTPCDNEVTINDGERVVTVDFVIDPGHGGTESGAVGPAGATEKALNLRIAEITEWYLEEAGYSVLLTRRSDYRIPLRSRAEIANALMPDAFISIHHNGGATRPQTTPGTEMFVDAGNPESYRLGTILFEELVDRLDGYEADWVGTWRNGVSARLNSDGADLYGIHRYTPDVVSVITEAGYLSNASEEALFVDNDVQWAHGRAIADGLIRWTTSPNDEGTGLLEDFTDDSSSGTGGFDGCTDPEL